MSRLRPNTAAYQALVVVGQVHEGGKVVAEANRIREMVNRTLPGGSDAPGNRSIVPPWSRAHGHGSPLAERLEQQPPQARKGEKRWQGQRLRRQGGQLLVRQFAGQLAHVNGERAEGQA